MDYRCISAFMHFYHSADVMNIQMFAGSCEDKLQLLFMMYDRDRSGSLSRHEVSEMIRYISCTCSINS